jgi:hypothetical protein
MFDICGKLTGQTEWCHNSVLKQVDKIRWTELLLNVGKARGFVGRRNMDCEEQMRCKGTSNLSDEGVGFFWWRWFVTVSNVHDVHTSAGCPK